MIKLLKRWFAHRRMIREVIHKTPPQGILMDDLEYVAERFNPTLVATAGSKRWRQVKFTALHNDIYYLLHAVEESIVAARNGDIPGTEVTKSRYRQENLRERTLDRYLVDETGQRAEVRATFELLRSKTLTLIQGVKNYKSKSPEQYDYYLRQNTNLFEELTEVFKLYIEVSQSRTS